MRINIPWIKAVLIFAGLFNIVWGIIAIFFQPLFFSLIELQGDSGSSIWVSAGIMASVMGIGYFFAASNVLRYWPIVLMGLLTKLLMPINVLMGYYGGEVSFEIFRITLGNHLIWWIPFMAILYRVYRQPFIEDHAVIEFAASDWKTSLEMYHTNQQRSILEASEEQPVMMVFLRHFGCSFCRETISMIKAKQDEIRSKGTKVILVHMVSEAAAEMELLKYGLNDLEHVSDQESLLYKAFKLQRGGFWQLFGPKVIWRSIQAGFIKKHGLGNAMGDIYQMPGIFLLHEGEIKKYFYHETAADLPPYLELAECSAR